MRDGDQRRPVVPAGRGRRAAMALSAVVLAASLAGCGAAATGSTGAAPPPAAGDPPTSAGTPTPAPTSTRPRPTGSPRPMGHIHGVGRDPATGDIVVATHGGLFRLDPSGATPVGPVVDLMGFVVAPDGSYLASGHPGPGTDLPQPLGLIRSTDGGVTWNLLSRGGASDFHALTAGSGVVAGFDGVLRVSTDGRAWQSRSIAAEPYALAASPAGDRLLATTDTGLLSSDDAGRSWSRASTPEPLVTVSWADGDTVVGVGLSGRLAVSEDRGGTWTTGPRPIGEVSSLTAYRNGGDLVVVLVIGGSRVLATTDIGRTTERLL